MKIWYSCKAKFNKELEDGMLKQVTEAYLLDAVSYTEAETRMNEICEVNVSGDFAITQITKTNIAEVIGEPDSEGWFKCKVVYATVDGDSDKEVKINTYLLVGAEGVKQAHELVEQHLGGMLVPYQIPSIVLTPFVSVHPYNAEEKPRGNLRPLSEVIGREEDE